MAPAAYVVLGEGKVPAAYEPQDRPTVVFVDDRQNVIPLNASRIRREIADKVSKNRVSVANALRLLRLPDDVQALTLPLAVPGEPAARHLVIARPRATATD